MIDDAVERQYALERAVRAADLDAKVAAAKREGAREALEKAAVMSERYGESCAHITVSQVAECGKCFSASEFDAAYPFVEEDDAAHLADCLRALAAAEYAEPEAKS